MHDHVWQLQEAKSRFSQLVEQALRDGPQTITRRGIETVVVTSVEDYRRHKRSGMKLTGFFRQPPFFDTELDIERSRDPVRSVEL